MKVLDPEADKKIEKERLVKVLYAKRKLDEAKKANRTIEISSPRPRSQTPQLKLEV